MICIGGHELFDDHETTANTNNQLSVENLRVNLFGTEPVLTATNLAKRYRAVSSVDVLTKHLIEDVTLRESEDRSLLLVADLLVHNFDDSILVFQEQLHLFDLIDLGVDSTRQFSQSINKSKLIVFQTLNIGVEARNVSVKISDLRRLQLDLLIEVDLLLSYHVKLFYLLVDNLLTLLECVVNLLNLLLNLLDLVLSIFNDAVAILNLAVEVRH